MRLIDADALIACLRKDPLYPLVERYGISGVIDSQPTIDAVPVIRCKDCKWWRESDHTCRHFLTSPRIPMDYCSRAERKEE